MPHALSAGFTEHLIVLNPIEPTLALIKIAHATGGTLRMVNDSDPLTHAAELYNPAAFGVAPPRDADRQVPRAQLQIAHTGNALSEYLARTRGARGARLTLSFVRRSVPEQVEGPTFTFNISSVTLTPGVATVDLSYDIGTGRGTVHVVYRPETAPGLFGT